MDQTTLNYKTENEIELTFRLFFVLIKHDKLWLILCHSHVEMMLIGGQILYVVFFLYLTFFYVSLYSDFKCWPQFWVILDFFGPNLVIFGLDEVKKMYTSNSSFGYLVVGL